MRHPKPFYRKQTQSWYVAIKGKFIPLGRDKEQALNKYHRMSIAPVDESDMTVAILLDRHYDFLVRNRAKATAELKKGPLTSFKKWIGPAMRIRALKNYHVMSWLAESHPNIGTTTQHMYMTAIKRAFNWAVQAGYIETSPVAKLKKPQSKTRQVFVPFDKWQFLIDCTTSQAFRDFVVFGLYSGARPQEMKKIEARHYVDGRIQFAASESKGKRVARMIYLPTNCKEIIERLIKENPEGPIFRDRKNRPWTNLSLSVRFAVLRKKSKMAGVCSTTLRHSFAHHRLSMGQDSLTVAKLMGHKDTSMIALVYGHLQDNITYLTTQAQFGSPQT